MLSEDRLAVAEWPGGELFCLGKSVAIFSADEASVHVSQRVPYCYEFYPFIFMTDMPRDGTLGYRGRHGDNFTLLDGQLPGYFQKRF